VPDRRRTIGTILPARTLVDWLAMLRRVLPVLVLALPVLVVTFAVLSGAALLVAGMGDAPGAAALRWIAIGTLIALAVDALLLLGALGTRAVQEDEEREE